MRASEEAHPRERVLIATWANFKVKKDKHCAAIASMEMLTTQDHPALNAKWASEEAHPWERVLIVTWANSKVKKVKQHAAYVTSD
tara:strand:+ start:398 stop:652 length:255 start_codon:yes stop_codon:yes gene_type:complete